MATSDDILMNAADFGLHKDAIAAKIVGSTQLGVGVNIANINAATPCVFPPATIVVIKTPTMYDNNPEFAKALKTVCESHSKSVTGIDIGYTLETADQPAGHDGQNFEVPTQSKRSQPSPTFVFPELAGNPIWNMFRKWVFDISHPDTNVAFNGEEGSEAEKKPFMSAMYSMAICVIQYDASMLPENIIDAYFITNMFPKDPGGTLGAERTIGTSNVKERSVNFTGLAQHNEKTRALGMQIATELKLHKSNYNVITTGETGVHEGIVASGLKEEISKLTTA